jgi:hypothetical protein
LAGPSRSCLPPNRSSGDLKRSRYGNGEIVESKAHARGAGPLAEAV